jgi:hypothetical protein
MGCRDCDRIEETGATFDLTLDMETGVVIVSGHEVPERSEEEF